MAYIENFSPPHKVPSPDQHPAERRRGRHCVVDLCPELYEAMAELARLEQLPLQTLVILLINCGLSERLARRASRGDSR